MAERQFVLRGVNDELWTHTARHHHDVVAAVAEEEQAAHVAAVLGQSGRAAAAVEEDVSGGPEGGKLAVQPRIDAVTPGSLFHIKGQRLCARIGVSSATQAPQASSSTPAPWRSSPRRPPPTEAASARPLPPPTHEAEHLLITARRQCPPASAADTRGGASSHYSEAAVPARFRRRNPPPSAVPCTAGQEGKTNTSIATTSGGLCLSVEALPVTGGASSTVAAAKSPTPASAYTELIDLADIATAQAACAAATNSPSLKLEIFDEEGVSLLYDTLTVAARPLVPAPHRRSSLLFAYRRSSLLYTHRRSSLLYTHRRSILLYTHRQSSLLYTHFWSSLLFSHRRSSLLFTHRRSSLLYTHRQSSLLYTHCWSSLLFAHRRSSQRRTSKQAEPEPKPGGGMPAGLRTRNQTRTRRWCAFLLPPVLQPAVHLTGEVHTPSPCGGQVFQVD